MCFTYVQKDINTLKSASLESPYKTKLHTHSTSDTKNSVCGQSNVAENLVMCSQWLAFVSLDDGCEPAWDSVYHPD